MAKNNTITHMFATCFVLEICNLYKKMKLKPENDKEQ